MTEMTLADYQARAASTALPTAYSYDYLIPAIVSEVGEVYGQRAKAARDGWDLSRLQTQVIKEYGDIAWPTAILLQWQGIDRLDPATARVIPTPIKDPLGDLLNQANTIVQTYEYLQASYSQANYQDFMSQVKLMWRLLDVNCGRITGQSFDYVLGLNTAKLASRKERGVIGGSGDDR